MNWISKLSFQLTDQKAFSLVELTVTVAIVGIIASLAVSQFEEYRTRANDLISLNQLLMARTAVEIVSSENPNSSFEYQYYDDLHGQFVINNSFMVDGLPGYVHVEDIYLSVSGRSNREYLISSTHRKGTLGAWPGPRGRLIPMTLRHHFLSMTGEIISTNSDNSLQWPVSIRRN